MSSLEATSDLDLMTLLILFRIYQKVSDELLLSMDRNNRELLKTALSYPETLPVLMNPDVITIRPDVTLDVVLRYIRMRGSCCPNRWEIYLQLVEIGGPLSGSFEHQ